MLRQITQTEFVEQYVASSCRWDSVAEEARHMALQHCVGAVELLAWEQEDIVRSLLYVRRMDDGALRVPVVTLEDTDEDAMFTALIAYMQANYAGETLWIWAYESSPLFDDLAAMGFTLAEICNDWICVLDSVEGLETFEDAHVRPVPQDEADTLLQDRFAFQYQDGSGAAGCIRSRYEQPDNLVVEQLCFRDGWNPAIQEALMLAALQEGREHGCEAAYWFDAPVGMIPVMRDLGFRRTVGYAAYYKKL